MRLLLDTHIWLWSVLQPDRISHRVAKELSDRKNELWLSPISVWELTFLHRKGRAKTPQDLKTWVTNSMAELRLAEASLTIEVALTVSELDFPHGDPGDHFIAATAKVFDLRLVTADTNLIKLRGIHVLPNR